MPDRSPLVVLTGASGFIGRSVTNAFLRSGWRVRALVRSPSAFMDSTGAMAAGVEALAWKLGDPAPDDAFAGSAAAFVHLAFETRGSRSRILRLNVEGTRLLLDAMRDDATTFRVLVSSFSAGPAAEAGLGRVSAYSRAKSESEQIFDPAKDLILRPGLVVGPGTQGLFARMRVQLERRVPIPLFYRGASPVQWIHVDELADLMVRAASARTAGVYAVASAEVVTLAEWTDAVGRALGTRPRTLSMPCYASDGFAWLLRLVERAGVRLPVTSDTILGVKYARKVDTRNSLDRLGASLSTLEETLRRAR